MAKRSKVLVSPPILRQVSPVEEMLKLMPESGRVVYIARHATPYDYTTGSRLQKVYGNHAREVYLSNEGIEEAYMGRDFICRELGRMRVVIHSPLPRAEQTAKILMGYYVVNPPVFVPDRRLEDIRLGSWLDVPRQDWTENRSLYWEEQLKSPGLDGRNPENPYQTEQRVVESFFDHLQRYSAEQSMLFVFHGDPICFLFQYLLKEEIMNLVGYREREGGKNVDKCTIWRVELSPKSVKIDLMFAPPSRER